MVETIKTLQIVIGLIIALVIVGWCGWRLLIGLGLIPAQKQKKTTRNHPKRENTLDRATSQPGVATMKKKGTPALSRQALYSSRKHPG